MDDMIFQVSQHMFSAVHHGSAEAQFMPFLSSWFWKIGFCQHKRGASYIHFQILSLWQAACHDNGGGRCWLLVQPLLWYFWGLIRPFGQAKMGLIRIGKILVWPQLDWPYCLHRPCMKMAFKLCHSIFPVLEKSLRESTPVRPTRK